MGLFVIILFYGTSGELIKIAPLLKTLKRESYLCVNTAQQPGQVKAIRKEAKIAEPDFTVANGYKGRELSKVWQLGLWFFVVFFNLIKKNHAIRKAIKRDGIKPIVMVHGDTVTTVIGALYGALNGYKVAHIEAGLRSHDWMNPFPEEIDRMIVSKIARIHFAPGDAPMNNLKEAKTKGLMVNTNINTVFDSMTMAKESKTLFGSKYNIPKEYGLASIHRNELMAKPEILKQLIITLNEFSEKHPIIFLDHPVTVSRLKELGYDDLFTSKGLIRIPKQSYYNFISLLAKSAFVVTDSGGLQEECAYLNIPCLLHRLATEREEGLGANVILSKFDDNVVRKFLKKPSKLVGTVQKDKISPTGIIIEKLTNLGFIRS